MRTISAVWSSWGPSPQLRTFTHALNISICFKWMTWIQFGRSIKSVKSSFFLNCQKFLLELWYMKHNWNNRDVTIFNYTFTVLLTKGILQTRNLNVFQERRFAHGFRDLGVQIFWNSILIWGIVVVAMFWQGGRAGQPSSDLWCRLEQTLAFNKI